VEKLIDAGADVNSEYAVCQKSDSIIVASTLVYFFACSCVSVCVCSFGVDPEGGLHCEQGGETPLHNACQSGSVEVAEILIRAGADIYNSDKVCKFPIMCGYE
jgi:ankyrin repeat protein